MQRKSLANFVTSPGLFGAASLKLSHSGTFPSQSSPSELFWSRPSSPPSALHDGGSSTPGIPMSLDTTPTCRSLIAGKGAGSPGKRRPEVNASIRLGNAFFSEACSPAIEFELSTMSSRSILSIGAQLRGPVLASPWDCGLAASASEIEASVRGAAASACGVAASAWGAAASSPRGAAASSARAAAASLRTLSASRAVLASAVSRESVAASRLFSRALRVPLSAAVDAAERSERCALVSPAS
jgi:hypothetical protein